MSASENYFERLRQIHAEAAADHQGGVIESLDVAGYRVRTHYAAPHLHEEFAPTLAHLPVGRETAETFDILVWDERSAREPMPAPPWSWENYMSRGELGGLDNDRYRAWFHVASGNLDLVDLERNQAVYWIRDSHELPMYVPAAPFRMSLQAWLAPRGVHYAHAAAVGTDDGAVLMAGQGGSGKSTTSLSCLDAGMRFLSDDYCLMSASPTPTVSSIYCSAKVDDEMLARFPRLAASRVERDDPPGEKTMLLLKERHEEQLIPQQELKALLAPRVFDQDQSTLVEIRPLAAIQALAPSTMEQISGPDRSAWQTITSLARDLPCYQLRLGRDVTSAPRVITDLLDSL